ncbi:ATP-dependent DNA helicase [Bacillus sp. V5-8f]|uniref:ATP-dependent DNA helicase n=1 Tax=Bacillus sp. V5-8f TaxID=2053044 RepID=UPI0026D12D51|nr:ATP-dependent DNA helicase [Bacillus sp. V5-8f]
MKLNPTRSLDLVSADSHPVHWAQAKCYAYMYTKANELDQINVQLTYVHTETEQIKRFQKLYSFTDLQAFIHQVSERYYPFAKWQVTHLIRRNQTVGECNFPFSEYRKGQRKLAGAVYQTIKEQRSLFVNAPTGIGKTISTIFPSLKAMGEGMVQKIFYLTARTTTKQLAEDAFSLLTKDGLSLKTVTITAKEKVCLQEETLCTKEECEFADGYYDRLNDAILDILMNENILNSQVIQRYARKHKLCPFEFSLDLAYLADAIICDYNYVFDPRVSLKRIVEEHKKKTVLLVDEAHNLVDRGRDMFSAELNKSPFLQLKREFKNIDKGLFTHFKEINQFFIDLKKEHESMNAFELSAIPETLIGLLKQCVEAAEQFLSVSVNEGDKGLLLEVYFAAQNFLRISQLYDEHYTIYAEVKRNEVRLKLFCLDPSQLLQKISAGFRATIHFSATLMPMPYYKEMLGASVDDYSISISSPFSREQTEVYIKRVSTRYRDRESSKGEIIDMLESILTVRRGNYLAFFPSYQYMNLIYEALNKETGIKTLIQSPNMIDAERDAFLTRFQEENESTLLAFAVMGGIFSEGIDLKGDRLNGVIVVGVGMPQIGFERDIIKNYFQRQGKNGFDYAYVYPGMNKVLQAGGRLIRSEQDHGLIVLADDRFLTSKYQHMLPEEWEDFTII